VPQATHALQYMNPGAVAAGLAHFLARHTLGVRGTEAGRTS
jgi:hypothetical protein